MTPFAAYEFKAAAVLAIFYMFYRLLLAKETFHRFNRAVLFGTAAMSMALPLCVITISREMPVESVVVDWTTSMDATGTAAAGSFPWIDAIIIAGAVISLAVTALSVIKTIMIIHSGEVVDNSDGIRTVVLDREVAPFSWMNTIVLSRSDWETSERAILLHERAHIRMRHSWDVLATDILTSLQWFNPAMWMLRDDLRAIHEFQADAQVLESGIGTMQYQYLLVRKAIGKSGYSVINGLNHSALKKRITMMSAVRSRAGAVLKALYLVPAIVICLAANARTVYTSAPDENLVAYTELDMSPSFNGGTTREFSRWVVKQLNYPDEAKDAMIQGRVTMSFTISKDGSLKDIRVLRGVNELLDAEALRVVSNSPKWTPGMKDGRPVEATMTFPIIFALR